MEEPSEDGRKTVLVVEDEFLIAIELKKTLTDGGFRVMGPANSVDTALYLLRDQRPDAAVLDFTLGGEKVTPVALLLKSLGVPFILASANTVDLAQYAIFTEVENLGKPTDLKRLIELVRAL